MKSSPSLFDPMVAGFFPISWVKPFPIAQEFNFIFLSGSIFHLKFVGKNEGLILDYYYYLFIYEFLYRGSSY